MRIIKETGRVAFLMNTAIVMLSDIDLDTLCEALYFNYNMKRILKEYWIFFFSIC